MTTSRTTDRPARARAPRVLSFRARLALILGQPQRQRRPTFYAVPSATARATPAHNRRQPDAGALFLVGVIAGTFMAAGLVMAARDAGLLN